MVFGEESVKYQRFFSRNLNTFFFFFVTYVEFQTWRNLMCTENTEITNALWLHSQEQPELEVLEGE